MKMYVNILECYFRVKKTRCMMARPIAMTSGRRKENNKSNFVNIKNFLDNVTLNFGFERMMKKYRQNISSKLYLL